MPELESPEAKQTDQISSILAGYLTPKNLAQALGVSERTVARWHRFREGPPRVEIGRKVFYRLESVNTWIASCEHPEARADRSRDDHACARSSRHTFRSRCSGTTSARLRERAAATIEAKRFVA